MQLFENQDSSVLQRREAMQRWLADDLGFSDFHFEPASSDASFRHYYRIISKAGSCIVMDAPPDKEDVGPFINVAKAFIDIGLNVPEILQADRENGFLLLSDMGTRSYLDELNVNNADRLYGDALAALAVIQSCGPRAGSLPLYDRVLLENEMTLFTDWLADRHCGIRMDAGQQQLITRTFSLLADNALHQPQVCVHRDYHSRNLMVMPQNNPGILDFQDAVVGAVTYDLVSLLRDCYVAWPRERVEAWALGYMELALQTGVLQREQADEKKFLSWLDLMGVQRHLKAAGIFARLKHRDGKEGYIKDIPRTLGYITEVCSRRDALNDLGELVEQIQGHIGV